MSNITIALAGNPNCGKTTLFNALTGANQYVGNWPGVTVEKKEGRLKGHKNIIIEDLPGIYSLSPYTLEEVVSRNYLVTDHPSLILNLVDGSNLERNLYLTTQLCELGVPVIIALNMMDIVRKRGDRIDTEKLSRNLGCQVLEISALKGTGIRELIDAVVTTTASDDARTPQAVHFPDHLEKAIGEIGEIITGKCLDQQKKWFAVKVFERDQKVADQLALNPEEQSRINGIIETMEREMDDDSESIITNERYNSISRIIKDAVVKASPGSLTGSDRIDRIITNRWLGLPIFAVVMFLVYWVAMVGVGAPATDWANDGVFGDGWHLLGIGSGEYNEVAEAYGDASLIVDGYEAYIEENGALAADGTFAYDVEDEETLAVTTETATLADYEKAKATLDEIGDEPDPADYGVWVPGVPVLVGNALESAGAADWLSGLILDGIVAGVGAVLGFVPQMLVLFFLLSILEDIGYMSRVAFIMDRIFRKFGLSGKSFIPVLVGTGCGVPGVMASRTIENERDRRMTIMTTCFIPCGAKMPIIGLIAGAMFGGSSLVAVSAYFIGMAAIICSGIMLKKTKLFAGDPAPFVMELPAYHVPAWGNVLRATWERGWSFIKRAGSVILAATVVLWFLQGFGFENGAFGMVEDQDNSVLAAIATKVAWIFAPLGFGNWRATVASVSGLIAKENVVGTFGVLYHFGGELSENGDEIWAAVAQDYTALSAYAFMIFNLLCAPCFAAMGAIKREMNNGKWTAIAIGYMCALAYCSALVVYQLGGLITGEIGFNFFTIVAAVVLVAFIYLMVRPNKYAGDNEVKIDVTKI